MCVYVLKIARGCELLITMINFCHQLSPSSLRRKQHKYPVMLLTCALNPDYGVPLDVRGHSLNDATMHARAHNLLVSVILSSFT